MSKLIIEKALQQAIATNNLHKVALTGGNEDLFTRPMVNYIPSCYEQVRTYRPPIFGGWRNIDLVKFHSTPVEVKPIIRNVKDSNIDWALEAKHYTPHQRISDLESYKQWSVGGCVKDILKLVDCRFEKFYILQLQTHITQIILLPGSTYQDLKDIFRFFPIYLNYNDIVGANNNLIRIVAENRITELEDYSRDRLDRNLLCGHIPQTIYDPIAHIDVTIHYFISGPFEHSDLFPRLTVPNGVKRLDPNIPLEDQVGGPGQTPTWDIDVSIESDPDE